MGLRLEWPRRAWEPGDALSLTDAPRTAVVETVRGADGAARLVHGDALDVARALANESLGGRVDLVYVDPPFSSQRAHVHEARLDGPADGRVVRATAYDDRWSAERGIGAYLDMLAPRLEALTRLLAPHGTIWVHVDWRASPYVRVVLDEILGRDSFVNEIVWRRAPNLGRQAASHQFGRTLDTIVVYGRDEAKLDPPVRLEPIDERAVRFDPHGRPFTSAPRGDYTDESIARLEKQGRVHRAASGKAYVKYFLVKNDQGVWCRERRVDALWNDVAPLRHATAGERTGYPTQKPRALLDRIVACASRPGGVVVDAFAGSGTTGESAHALGRRFVLGDASPIAIATARARLLRAGVKPTVEQCGGRAVGGQSIRASVEREGARVRVTLREPSEPLAWAIDARHDPSRGFVTTWHSERVPGTKTQRAARSALVDALVAESRARIAVRVWSDDGALSSAALELT